MISFRASGEAILGTQRYRARYPGLQMRSVFRECFLSVFCFFLAGWRGRISVLTLTLHKNRLAGISVLMLTRGVY